LADGVACAVSSVLAEDDADPDEREAKPRPSERTAGAGALA
jgi:hypothetical protein